MFFLVIFKYSLSESIKNVFMRSILEPQVLTLYFKFGRNEIDVLYSCKMLKIRRAEMS